MRKSNLMIIHELITYGRILKTIIPFCPKYHISTFIDSYLVILIGRDHSWELFLADFITCLIFRFLWRSWKQIGVPVNPSSISFGSLIVRSLWRSDLYGGQISMEIRSLRRSDLYEDQISMKVRSIWRSDLNEGKI